MTAKPYKTSAFLLMILILTPLLQLSDLRAEDGYDMWLRYKTVANQEMLADYRNMLAYVVAEGDSPTIRAAKKELESGLNGLLDRETVFSDRILGESGLLIGTPDDSETIAALDFDGRLEQIGREGFLIEHRVTDNQNLIIITANEDIGVLYGVFHLLRLIQTERTLHEIALKSAPRVKHRMANHWDNLNRLVERGYAGLSLWEWGTLPEYKHPRYTDYARFSASIGINGVAINNVNANPDILTDPFLEKAAVLADIFRPYGLTVFLSVNFDSPRRLGGLDTADPLNEDVRNWWKEQADNIYAHIPDFGGFLVKADSEGQPGPHGYNRTHADGANMLAEALEPHGGIVVWRAFVYNPEQSDRFREAYDEFVPLDGEFAHNTILQVKNGPIDFQPREPFSPLFGALEETNTMIELQVTQEYFGFNLHLAYQGTLFEEVLQSDTFAKGQGSTVAKVLDGELFDYELTGMAGVINAGTDRNWTGHPFVQSSWYAFGRLAWDHTLSAEEIADEWIRMTFTNDEKFVEPVRQMMMESREAGVNYRSPLGLTHLYAQGHHYGPAPWWNGGSRPDWNPYYYHQADENGIGFDRTETGSNAVAQYFPGVAEIFADARRIPDDYLLWFHRVGWEHPMQSGRTLWEEMVHKYSEGVETVRQMQQTWNAMEGRIDEERFEHVKALLKIQERDAVRWRDTCLTYFQSFSNMPIPDGYEKPEHDLEHYMMLWRTTYVPDPWYN